MVEEQSDLAEKLWESADLVFTCRLAYPEARAALAAAWRDDRLSTAEHVQAIEGLDALIAELAIVEVGAPIAQHAGDLADRFALRGYDAVHLAAALALRGDDDRRAPTVATWDARLGRSCMKAGLMVVPPPPRDR